MDAIKGIHAFATSVFGILLLGFTYTFFNKAINAYQDSSIKILILVSYIIINILFILVVPALIVMQGSSNASVASALVGYGAYATGVIVVNIFWWIVDAFVDSATGNVFTNFGQGSLPTQFLSFLFILGLFLLVYIIPILIMLYPEILDDRLAGVSDIGT